MKLNRAYKPKAGDVVTIKNVGMAIVNTVVMENNLKRGYMVSYIVKQNNKYLLINGQHFHKAVTILNNKELCLQIKYDLERAGFSEALSDWLK